MMPPQGAPRPDEATLRRARRVARDRARSRGGRAARIPGRPLLHRLNRAEYANAIRDLLGARRRRRRRCCRPTTRRTASTTSPTCSASRRRCSSATCRRPTKISALAVGDPAIRPRQRHLPRPPGPVAGPAHRRPAARHASAACSSRHTFPLDGEYVFQVEAVPHEPRHRCAASSTRTSSRSPSTASACTWRRSAATTDFAASLDEPDRRRATPSTRGCSVRVPRQGRPARRSASRSSSSTRGAGHAAAAAVPAQLGRHAATATGPPAHRDASRSPGPFNADRARRHAEPPARSSSAVRRRPRRRSARARGRSSRRSRAAPIARPVDRRGPRSALLDVLRGGPARRHVRDAASRRALQRILASPKFVFRVERDPAGVAAGHGLPHQRPRARVAAVVLPLEQHPRRRAAATWPAQGKLHDAGGARAAGAAHAGRSAGRRRSSTNFAGQWLYLRNLQNAAAELGRVPGLRRQPARRRSGARPSCSSTASCARTAASSTC